MVTARHIVCSALLISLFIAPAASCEPVFGDEPSAGLPADLTARVDELFAKWSRRDTPGCAVGIVHRGACWPGSIGISKTEEHSKLLAR